MTDDDPVEDSADALRAQGEQLDRAERYEEAAVAYEKILKYAPADNGIRKKLIILYSRFYQYKDALMTADEGLIVDPYDLNLLLYKGAAQYEMKQFADAVVTMRRVVEQASHEVLAWRTLGLALFELRRYPEALEAFQHVVNCARGDSVLFAWHNVGRCYLMLKEYQHALDAFDRSFSEQVGTAPMWRNKGLVLFRLQRYEEALAAYQRSLDKDPDNIDVWKKLALIFDKLQRNEEGAAVTEQIVQREPNNAFEWFNRSVFLMRLKRSDEAIAALYRVTAIRPDYYDAWRYLDQLLFSAKRFADALVANDHVIQITGENADQWVRRGAILLMLKCYDNALAAFDRALALKPFYSMAWKGKAQAMRCRYGRIAGVITSLRAGFKLAKHFDDTVETSFSIGQSLLAEKMFDVALIAFEAALKHEPSNIQALQGKIAALRGMKRFSRAEKAEEHLHALISEGTLSVP